MAPSATASTVTSIPKPLNEKTIRVNGKGGGDNAPAAAQDDLARDPVEVKYRDFFWTYTEEPHRTRRLQIIKAHPEVRQPDETSLKIALSALRSPSLLPVSHLH
jgi:sphingolipid delta-4 desaturase